MILAIELSIKAGARIDKHISLNQIYRYGAIGAANRLIKEGTKKLHSGLIKLYEVKRLDLTIESIVLKEKYAILFDPDILLRAKLRLEKLKS